MPNIFPVFRYDDAPAAIDWLVRCLGFSKQAEVLEPDGGVAHAELTHGAGVIGLSSRKPPIAANPWSSVRQGLYVAIEDVDAHHRRARDAGAKIAIPPRDTAYGSREYSAHDIDGYLWSFGTYGMGAKSGEPSIVPELRYRNLEAAGDWLTKAFGFRTTLTVPGPGGSPVHAELRLGDGTIFIGPSSGEAEGEWADVTQFANVAIDDPDAHHARAQAAGARIVIPPTNTPFGARFYAVRDLENFLWWLSTYRPAH